MAHATDNPIIVQGDRTILLETMATGFEAARDALLGFAELVKSPEYVHTWRLTPLSLWNAAAAGHTAADIVDTLRRLSKYPVPEGIPTWIEGHLARYGRLRLVRDGERLRLESDDPVALAEVASLDQAADLLGPHTSGGLPVHPRARGELKRVLLAAGHPVEDLAGYDDGEALTMALAPGWSMRDYQVDAVDAFLDGAAGGSGVVVLPCGAGKTIVGIAAMVRLGMRTLIVCTGQSALLQWKREILARTTLREDEVGEYGATVKELRPVTLTTYQLLTWRKEKHAPPAHFRLFHEANWGLVIYDEVHLLPAPIFRETAFLQARRRLGLTATLVREDGHEGDVFALVGPKRFDLPWKTLEHQGWIASARCVEVRVPLADDDRLRYARAGSRSRFQIATRNARKGAVLEGLLARHAGARVLVLGTDVQQLGFVARRFGMPLVTGETPSAEREVAYAAFRSGETPVLAVSRVGNLSIDLPEASVAVQISGTWGSRQEEAQRLGRVLRPKTGENQAHFYTLVSADTDEQTYAERRQLFLCEQGYPYRIELASVSGPRRAVSVLEVADELVWKELDARMPLEEHLGDWLSPLRRVVHPSFDRLVHELPVLVRYARASLRPDPESASDRVASLPAPARRLLDAAAHHAVDGVVLGFQAWDPLHDADAVRALVGAGLLEPLDERMVGRYRLLVDHRGEAPPLALDEALMPPPDDLPPDAPGALALLHDLASYAAAIEHVRPTRTLAGDLAKTDAKRLRSRLGGDPDAPRWSRALRGLVALGVVATDPTTREVHLDLALEATLRGDARDAVDQLVRRLLEADLHGVLPAVREVLRQADGQAVDEVVLLDCLREQWRDVLFPGWRRDGAWVYPMMGDEKARTYDDDGWAQIEVPMIERVLTRLTALGVLRRAPGVFAATSDGDVWARADALRTPPVWLTGDLELLVPPGSVTPWERFQLERLGRCLQRDVVDRYRLERDGVVAWLATHDLDEALALLRRRCPGVPAGVEDTLRSWADRAMRAVLVRGVVLAG